MKKIFAVLTIILFTVSLACAADDPFSKIDKNKDGKISKQEYLDAVNGNFDKLDKNHDGILTREELQLNGKIDVDKFIKETDTNNDGKISKREYQQAAKKRFNQLDKDKNGFIDKNEWSDDRSPAYSPFTLFTF
jgi:Ca2+-binding EF-hand superfamily protein